MNDESRFIKNMSLGSRGGTGMATERSAVQCYLWHLMGAKHI